MLEVDLSSELTFLSHLSGDEGSDDGREVKLLFLSHLSGDEASKVYELTYDYFLSHLSGDEEFERTAV